MASSEAEAIDLSAFPRDMAMRCLFIVLLMATGVLVRFGVYLASQGPGSFGDYVDALCVWDCVWYRTIIESGYQLAPLETFRPGAANWAFFPLSPLLAASLHKLLGLPVIVAGFVASNIYACIAALVARPLFGERPEAYWLWVFALLVGPFSMLFSTLYTEGLFILLTILSLLALQRQRYLAAGLWAGLLSATRVTGVLMTVAILVSAVVDQRRAGVPWRHIPLSLLRRPDLLLALFIAPLGLFIYMAYLHLLTGDGFAFMHIQRAWGRDAGNPLAFAWEAIWVTQPLTPDRMLRMTWSWCAVIGLALSAVLLLTRRQAAGTFTGLAILASLTTGVTSMIRFSAGLAPLGMLVAELLSRWRIVYWLAFPALFLLGLATTAGWFRSSLFVM